MLRAASDVRGRKEENMGRNESSKKRRKGEMRRADDRGLEEEAIVSEGCICDEREGSRERVDGWFSEGRVQLKMHALSTCCFTKNSTACL